MVTVIVVAAGTGSRFGSTVPKQFCQIDGRPTVMRAIDAMRASLDDARILLVLSAAEADRWQYLCNLHGFDSPDIVVGGATRWESVRNAIRRIEVPETGTQDIIMVHDGARPLVSDAVVKGLLTAFDDPQVQGAIPAVAVTDSLRRLEGDKGRSVAVDRGELRAVQTPQAFRADLLVEAYKLPYSQTFTDDASVMEAAGYERLLLTPGDPCNIKITNPFDIAIAETILANL